jgi:signal transduction histidine kinase
MWRILSLKTRLLAILSTLAAISLIGGSAMIWYTFRMETLLSDLIQREIAAYEAAEALEIALVNQKGFVSYYFMDGSPNWLRRLGEARQIFKERLTGARQLSDNADQLKLLARLEKEYLRYAAAMDQVIDLYKAGKTEQGTELHRGVREGFSTILKLCSEYRRLHKNQILQAQKKSSTEAVNLRIIAAAAVGASFLLVFALSLFLLHQILDPVRRLTQAADRHPDAGRRENEISALNRSVRGLLEDVHSTHLELERSREHLLQSEKLALVGKLAAGMAHSIRNPFTSVKMRLFSLSRALELTETQRDDLRVISEEIRHIDAIVQNFLEFSRPPRLQIQQVSPSSVVDQALQLMVHRLKSYAVDIHLQRKDPLPEIPIDPEQLKEVLVNLIVNACEAMESDGRIIITEEVTQVDALGPCAMLRLADNGPGIPPEILQKVFQPFFTTKEDGTGLGLSIASRIIEEHRGILEIESDQDQGATFRILLPLKGVSP